MNLVISSIRQAVRQLWASRVFTGAAVLTLALGIGATTAIFTLIHAVMLRSLPVSNPARLYRIGDGGYEGIPGRWGFFPFPLYERLKAAAPEFEDIAAFDWGGSLLSVRRQGAEDASRPLHAEYVTGSYFSTLGAGAFIGRVFAPDDDRPSAPPVVVLGHHAWKGTYAADPSVVGSTLVVEGHPFTVVGVAASGFFGDTLRADPPDIWIPLQQEPVVAGSGSLLHQSFSPWLFVIGRLRQDADIAGMAPRLTGILRHWMQYDAGYPPNQMSDIIRDLPKQTVAVVPAGAGVGVLKEQYNASLRILLAICGLVLVAACANVANLLLARTVVRRTQTAVRFALGATRRRIIVEALTESVLLAVAGAVAGLVVAITGAQLLVGVAFRNSQFLPITAMPSPPILAFAVGLALATGIVFGAVPAWLATRTGPINALRGSGRSTSDHSSRAQTTLLVVQVTMSVMLVAGSTMLARSLANLQRQDFGYPLQGRLTVGLNRLPSTYTPQQLSTLYRDIEQRLTRLPGVRGAGLALYNPLTSNWSDTVLLADHRPSATTESGVSWNRVSADYLQNLGVPVVRGRLFAASDNETAARVAVVNEAFVARFFRDNEDPLDQHFGVERPENARTFRIIGVVRDAKFARLAGRLSALNGPARPMFFVPLAQRVEYTTGHRQTVEALSHFIQGLLLLTDSPTGNLEPQLRKLLADADPNLTITSVRTMQQQVDLSFDRERAVATLAGIFGIISLVLAVVGVYGVTAFMVAQRRNDIGIRMALGADRAKVVRLVVAAALRRVTAGLVGGLVLAVSAGRLMSAQLYGVSFWDPFALALGAGSLAGCALLAALIPAGRAAAISPVSALRAE